MRRRRGSGAAWAPGSCAHGGASKRSTPTLMIAFMCVRMGLRGIADTTGSRNSNRIHELRNGFVGREDHLYRARARCTLRGPITTRADHQMIRPQRDKAIMQHGSAATARERWSWVAKPGERFGGTQPACWCRDLVHDADRCVGAGFGARQKSGVFFDFSATQCHFVPRFGGPTKIRKPM